MEWVLGESAPPNRGSSGKYEGVGAHLAAIAIKRSFETGGDGVVFFFAHTEREEHYKRTLGAVTMSHKGERVKMIIWEDAAKSLYDTYFGGNK